MIQVNCFCSSNIWKSQVTSCTRASFLLLSFLYLFVNWNADIKGVEFASMKQCRLTSSSSSSILLTIYSRTEVKWHDKKGKGHHVFDYNHVSRRNLLIVCAKLESIRSLRSFNTHRLLNASLESGPDTCACATITQAELRHWHKIEPLLGLSLKVCSETFAHYSNWPTNKLLC